jgi:FkbM family methyltransferase
MNKALAAEEGQKFDLSRNFRDGLDWSVVTEENPSGQTSSITIDSIISEYSLKHISLLKIDIEGYERFVFDKAKNLDFLKMVFVIAIEIHDEFKSRQVIEGQLIAHGFTLFNSGELTVGINKNHVLNA